MSFTRADYAKVFDFAEVVYRDHPEMRSEAERVMAMVETVIGQQRAFDARVNPHTASAAYQAACGRR